MFVLFEIVAGLVLATGFALVVASRGRGRGFPACGACGYNVTGSIGTGRGCPECGCSFTRAGIVAPRARLRPGLLVLGVLMGLLGIGWGTFWAVAFIY